MSVHSPFNSPLECGVRTLVILVAAFPTAHDLQRLVQYDYLTVHSADADGPPSIHPPLPLRSGELLVRRSLLERGLNLMMSRDLIRREMRADGIFYRAEETAGALLKNLRAPYVQDLCGRARWVADTFEEMSAEELDSIVRDLFESWTIEFQASQPGRFPVR